MINAVVDQENILKNLIKVGRTTEIGKEAGLDKVNSYEEFRQAVPVRDYEQMRPWVDKIKEGRHNVLWKGKPIYFAKTSGKRVNNSLVFNNKSSKSIAPALKQRST